ncbi:fumarylacetoacetase [Spiractinospora alimapuensis]|uniref:fumarylacetoacetase n=1 Tax=Spiractinospora alimapuensis TaxID=2820884 RepID=UPI001F479074|nr:fumarylacetoacetase [Spiractinospora alimapuensis]QVQ51175.1 fumarylacetoacetase [Spiractinospora alimapuensis]
MNEPWVPVPPNSGFGIAHLPYGVFATRGTPSRVGVRIGDLVLDLAAVLDDPVFSEPSLNGFMAQGRESWRATRARVVELLSDERHRPWVEEALYPVSGVALRMPFVVADYVDFYASEHHATNLGRILRPDTEPLPPNWKHFPVGYHGRAGTVVVSGTPILRPQGQRRAPNDALPTFGSSTRLDLEAEVGFVVGCGSPIGERVSPERAEEHLFGAFLLNDWSARDIQAWEYVPLGPFLGKSFATTVSAWVTPMEALTSARIPGPEQDPAPVDYLTGAQNGGLDLRLSVTLNGEEIARPPYRQMYWSPAQMLAHMTINGASLRPGDLFASGTVSGPERGEWGSLMELAWNGTRPLTLRDGSTRSFLDDGDVVTLTATAPGPNGSHIALGEATGQIIPAS